MSDAANEFSDLDRTVVGPDGASHEIVVHVGYGVSGWAMLWGKGRRTHVPIVTVSSQGRHMHQEPAADRGDAERIISSLEKEIAVGRL